MSETKTMSHLEIPNFGYCQICEQDDDCCCEICTVCEKKTAVNWKSDLDCKECISEFDVLCSKCFRENECVFGVCCEECYKDSCSRQTPKTFVLDVQKNMNS